MLHESPLRALVGAIREVGAPEAIHGDLSAFLRRHEVSGDDLAAMSSSKSGERMLVYRSLVQGRFRGAVEVSIPRVVDALGNERLEHDVARFVEERAAGSPYLRDIASEFVEWAIPVWRSDSSLPPHLADLARHELLGFELGAALDEPVAPFDEGMELDRPLVFRGPWRLAEYEFAVHRIDEPMRASALAEPTRLLAYRDAEDGVVRFLELSPSAWAILTRLLHRGQTVREAIAQGCESAGIAMDDSVLAGAAELFATLAERGVLLGVAA